jgi:lysyl-tRNA synthetase class I
MDELNHWADVAAARTLQAHPDQRPITVAAGITPSGVVHIGNFREVMTVDLVARALRDRGGPLPLLVGRLRRVPQGPGRRARARATRA